MDPWRIPQARAALAFRTAVSVVICGSLGAYLSDNTSPTVFNYAQAALAPIFAYLVPVVQRGETCKLTLTWIASTIYLVPLGIGVGYLCFLAGGMQWRQWLLSIGTAAAAFITVIWGNVANLLHQPKLLLAGSPAALLLAMLCPALALAGPTDHLDLLLDTACMTGAIVCGSVVSLALSHLPFGLGAASAGQQAPMLAAEKMAALAETFEAVAIWQHPTTAALLRHRECRLRLINASHGFRLACTSASYELWGLETSGSFIGDETPLEALSLESESCRLNLQLKSRMVALGISPLSAELFYTGPTGEAMRDSCFAAAAALRASSSRLAEIGGTPPPSQIPAAPWLHATHATPEDCKAAASQCREALSRFLDAWGAMYLDDAPTSWKARLEEVAKSPKTHFTNGTNGKTPAEYFLDGSYHRCAVPEAHQQECSLIAAFDEASRNAASLIGVSTAAESAANLADLVARATPAASHCGFAMPSVTGMRKWLMAPFAGRKAWAAGFAKGKSFGLRVSMALLLTGLGMVCLPPNPFWPGQSGLWTLITVGLIITPVQGASLLRGLRRVLGTVAGSGLALASVALMGAAPSFRMLWPQMFLMAFGMKFFEAELQYAGAVTFITYMVVVNNLADNIEAGEVPPLQFAAEVALRRCVDVMMGVLVAMVVSIFLAPDRAIDELRKREEAALRCAAAVLRRATMTLAARAEGPEELSSPGTWADLRADAWTSFEALNFAGDGQPGVADLLEDARWEGRWGVDGGFLVLGGLLWLPELCRCRRRRKKSGGSAPGSRQCLEAVISISRLLRLVNILIALLQQGLGEDADRPLANDPRVLEALGRRGVSFSEPLDTALEAASALLGGADAESKAEEALADLQARLRLLALGAGASRQKAGGLAANKNLGGLRAAAALKILEVSTESFIESVRRLEGTEIVEELSGPIGGTSYRSTTDSSSDTSPDGTGEDDLSV